MLAEIELFFFFFSSLLIIILFHTIEYNNCYEVLFNAGNTRSIGKLFAISCPRGYTLRDRTWLGSIHQQKAVLFLKNLSTSSHTFPSNRKKKRTFIDRRACRYTILLTAFKRTRTLEKYFSRMRTRLSDGLRNVRSTI